VVGLLVVPAPPAEEEIRAEVTRAEMSMAGWVGEKQNLNNKTKVSDFVN